MSEPTTTPSANERTLDRVRKLLAKAEGTDNEHERETFMAAANALMAKYGIEQAMLGAKDRSGEKPINRRIIVDNPWADVKANLIYYVAEALGCKSVLVTIRSPVKQRTVQIYGFESDIERAEVLYTSLLLQMASGVARVEIPSWENPRSYRRSWMLAFKNEVIRRIRAAERAAAQAYDREHATGDENSVTGPSTEVVLASRRDTVTQAMREAHPELRKTSGLSSRGGGWSAGRAAGQRANIGGTGVGRGSRGAIGGAR
jgi:hypothetical protein